MPTEDENVKFLFLLLKHSDYSKTRWEEISDKLDINVGAASKRMSRLRQAVAKGESTTNNGADFLYLCLKHSDATTFKWDQIADEMGLKKGAVSKRWSRLQQSMDKGKDGAASNPATPKKSAKASAASTPARSAKKGKAGKKSVKKEEVDSDDEELHKRKTGTPDSMQSREESVDGALKNEDTINESDFDVAIPNTPVKPKSSIKAKAAATPASGNKRKRATPAPKIMEEVNADDFAAEGEQVGTSTTSEATTTVPETPTKTISDRRNPRRAASNKPKCSADGYFEALGIKNYGEADDEESDPEVYFMSAKKPKFNEEDLGDTVASAEAPAENETDASDAEDGDDNTSDSVSYRTDPELLFLCIRLPTGEFIDLGALE